MCEMSSPKVENEVDEYLINSYTGSLLLPKNVIIPTEDPDEIFIYSKRFKISSEVYLRRLKDLNYIQIR